MEKSFFTEIQLETLLIDFLTYDAVEPRISQSYKAQARQKSKGRSRGSYNRVLRQARTKLEKTLYSMLLLGYLGILGDTRTSTFVEASQSMQEYLKIRHNESTKAQTTAKGGDSHGKRLETETELRKRLYKLVSGTETVTP
jgi:hypothetical protein